MTKPYGDFNDSENHEDDDDDNDDEIGALGSILSWDEEEDGAGDTEPTNLTLSDRGSLHTSALPDLVSFNMKEGELSTLQHIPGSTGQSVALPTPMHTQINYGNAPLTVPNSNSQMGQQKQQSIQSVESTEQKQQYAMNAAINAQKQPIQHTVQQQQTHQIQQQHIQQQQQQHQIQQQIQQQMQQQQQIQQQQIQQQQQQIQQQAVEQQNQQQQQTQKQTQLQLPQPPQTQQQQQQQLIRASSQQTMQTPQQLLRTPSQQTIQSHQQLIRTSSQQTMQTQQQVTTSDASQQQAPTVQSLTSQQNAIASNLGAYAFFQQNGLLGQPQNTQQQIPLTPTLSNMMMPNLAQQGQDQRTDQQATPQFPFTTDPNAFLRQLQVAQLQQQFNSFQQARSLQQQVPAAATPVTQMPTSVQQQQQQQQMQFQPQASIPQTAPVVPAHPPVAPAASVATATASVAPKKARAHSTKKPPTSKPPQSKTGAASKAPVVSASDTDGELSSKVESVGRKDSKKAKAEEDFEDKDEIDTSNMTPAEKAKANRDRNREHARNTRLRKKAYLEKLKSTVDELCRERDTLVSERAGAANILVDMHNTRTEVLMSFFALRSANEKRRELWSSILDESCFACVLPVTPYRSFPASEVQVSKCQRTILGIDGMMSDTASLHVLLNSLVDRSRFPNATIVFRYTLVTEEAVVAGNQMMARWVMSTLNATQCGARMEVAKQGMLCCKFNSAHKIIGLELMFDVMALMLQLKQAAGADTFSVIPNTVQTCQRSFDKPMVMTLAEEPYTIMQVNKLWEDVTGYKAEEVVGKSSCRILEGEETDSSAVEVLMNEIRFKRPASAMLVNYKKSGELFRNFILVYPLSTDSRITHYLYLSSHVDTLSSRSAKKLSATVSQAQQGLSIRSLERGAGVPAIAPGHITSSAPGPQAFFNSIQNMQGTAGSGQASAPQNTAQSLLGLAPVLSNTLPGQQAQGSMLPPGLTGTGVLSQSSLRPPKRSYNGDSSGMPSRKHSKTGEDPAA